MKNTAPYEAIIKHMIANDEPCQGVMCNLTMMGHLLDGLDLSLTKKVMALDPDAEEYTSPEFAEALKQSP